jgi:hypothetical protein
MMRREAQEAAEKIKIACGDELTKELVKFCESWLEVDMTHHAQGLRIIVEETLAKYFG